MRPNNRIQVLVGATMTLAVSAGVLPAALAATATPTMQLLSVTQWGPDSIGYDHIVGEVVNNSSTTATFIDIVVNLYSASGTLLATDSTFPSADTLDPGQASPFEYDFQPPAGYDHFAIGSISPAASDTPANSYFGVQISNVYIDSIGETHYVGTVTNDNSTTSQFVQLTLTGYDPSGRAVDTDFTYPNTNSTGDLTAGQSAPFDVTILSGDPSFTSYRIQAQSDTPPSPVAQNHPVSRIAGTDAVATAIAISQQSFADQTAKSVVLARSDYFSDALAGGPLAADGSGPLLITPGAASASSLDPRVMTEIQRALPSGGTVYILGGTYALSPNIDSELSSSGYHPVRLAGQTAAGTAVDIAQQISTDLGHAPTIFEATGTNFPDALAAVPAAVKDQGAILLTDGATQDPATAGYIQANPTVTRYAIGGPYAAAGADPSAVPVWGYDLYDTAAVVAARFFPTATVYGAATGGNYPDALGGGVFMADGGRSGPMLLVSGNTPLPLATHGYLTDTPTLASGYLFGGTAAVAPAVATALSQS